MARVVRCSAGHGLFWRGLVGCLSCRGPGSFPTSLEAPRVTSGRRRQSQSRCKPSAFAAPGVTPLHVDSRGSSWITCGTTLTRRPAPAIEGASWKLTLSSTSSTRPRLEKAVLNGLFPDPYPPFFAPAVLPALFAPAGVARACYPINLVRSCWSRLKLGTSR
jgi:hypothetical protein